MYYPDVHPDEPFMPSATLANDIRHLLNAESVQGDPAEAPQNDGRITVTVRNSGTVPFVADQAVQFPAAAPMADEILPVRGFTTAELPWGIVLDPLAPGEIGECVLNGPATITLDTGSGHYATPYGTAFRHSSAGVPILAEYLDGTATRGIVSAGCQSVVGGGTYTLPPATTASLGGIKVGQGLWASSDGTLTLGDGIDNSWFGFDFTEQVYRDDQAIQIAGGYVTVYMYDGEDIPSLLWVRSYLVGPGNLPCTTQNNKNFIVLSADYDNYEDPDSLTFSFAFRQLPPAPNGGSCVLGIRSRCDAWMMLKEMNRVIRFGIPVRHTASTASGD